MSTTVGYRLALASKHQELKADLLLFEATIRSNLIYGYVYSDNPGFFSGMAAAIIQNSDYESVDEAKEAIDRYFRERNEHFKKNPKRAGNKIWGEEIVAPVFKEGQNCKNRKWR